MTSYGFGPAGREHRLGEAGGPLIVPGEDARGLLFSVGSA